jgi:hypothetical protein
MPVKNLVILLDLVFYTVIYVLSIKVNIGPDGTVNLAEDRHTEAG